MSPRDLPRELLALVERDRRAALILAGADEPQKDAASFHLLIRLTPAEGMSPHKSL